MSIVKKLYIDRFDGKYAICEDNDAKLFAIELENIPKEAKEGDVISISKEGEISIDKEATKARKKKIKAIQDKLFR